MLHDLGRGVKNLIKWFPVIWEDRDFDWYYMFKIMEKKLLEMERAEYFSWHANSGKDAHRIKVCRLLIQRIQKDDYWENACKIIPASSGTHEIANYMQNQDMDMLFSILRKHCLGWWT